ncbi:MAG: hypothetical protein ACE5EG_06235, partial [Thermoanaerobaculia bacterium]
TTASILTSAAISAALAGVGMLTAPKPKTAPTPGVTTTLRNPTAYRKGVYGRRRVGGVLVFIDTRDGDNDKLDLVIALAAHQIDAVEEMYFGDDLVWTAGGGVIAEMASRVRLLEVHLGTPGDPASPGLTAVNAFWDANHRLEGIAYFVITLAHSAKKFPAGIPNMSFVIRGKADIKDPRDLSVGYTNNAALCIRDFLTDTKLGLGVPESEIDEASFIAGANLADETVALAEGGDEPRYTCNGVFDTNTQFGSTLEMLLSSMGARLTYSSGKFRLINPVYEAPTLTLDERHIRGQVNVQSRRTKRNAFNGVRGTFAAELDNFVEADYPPVVSSAFELEDGEPLYKDLPLPFTTSAATAQRLAKVELLRGRQQISAVVPVNLAAIKLVPGDNVALTLEQAGWSAKPFEVEGWAFSVLEDGALGIDLSLIETASTVYDWTTDDQAPHVAGIPTNLPDGLTINAPGIAVSEEERTENEDIFTVLLVDVTSSDAFAAAFEVEFKLNSETIWRAAGRAASGRYEVVKAADGALYDIRARVLSVTGVLSDWTTFAYTVVGSVSPPPDVTGLTASAAGPQTHLEWDPVADLRLSYYEVRHSPKIAGVSWEASTVIVPKVARPASSVTVASRAGTYLVNAALIVSPIAATDGLNVVAVITESPGFAGAKTGVEVRDGNLVLAGTVPFDSLPGLFDDLPGLFDELSNPLVASGTYEFAAVFDLGAVYTSRVFAGLEFDASGGASAFDNLVGLFDDLPGLFDDLGGPDVPGLTAHLEMAYTSDDPGGAPVWSAWAQLGVAEVTARAKKFRAILSSTDDTATPAVTALSATVDMPDRVVSVADLQSTTAAGGLAVVFPGGAFKALPAVGISPQDMAQGDFFEIPAKSVSGFTVRFKNSGGTVIDRKFDYDAKGYGRITA